MSTLASQFANRLNNHNTKSIELGDPLFKPLDQIQRNEKEFRVTGVRFKDGCFVSFADGSRVYWDDTLKLWNVQDVENLTVPEQHEKLLHVVESHYGVSDAFITHTSGQRVDIAVVVEDEDDFRQMSFDFDFTSMPESTKLTVKRFVDTEQFFICKSAMLKVQ